MKTKRYVSPFSSVVSHNTLFLVVARVLERDFVPSVLSNLQKTLLFLCKSGSESLPGQSDACCAQIKFTENLSNCYKIAKNRRNCKNIQET